MQLKIPDIIRQLLEKYGPLNDTDIYGYIKYQHLYPIKEIRLDQIKLICKVMCEKDLIKKIIVQGENEHKYELLIPLEVKQQSEQNYNRGTQPQVDVDEPVYEAEYVAQPVTPNNTHCDNCAQHENSDLNHLPKKISKTLMNGLTKNLLNMVDNSDLEYLIEKKLMNDLTDHIIDSFFD